MSPGLSILGEIQQCARAMLDAADRDQWQALAQLQTTQHAKLRAFFHSLDAEISVSEQRALLEIQTLNQQVIALVADRHRELAKELRNFGQGRRALQAYHGYAQ